MKVTIVLNAYEQNISQLSKAGRIKEELESLKAQCEIVRNFRLADIKKGRVVSRFTGKVVFLDKDKEAAALLESAGCRLYNSAYATAVCDDKMLTYAAISGIGADVPDSVYAPLCYYQDADIPEKFLCNIASELGLPLVAKLCYGSLGNGVFLIKNMDELYAFENEHKLEAHLYQKYITPAGEDIRCILVGGEFLCAMKRFNKSDFRSNIEKGGKGVMYEADSSLISLCERVAKKLKLDYCGIDVLTDEKGRRYICEVNSNAFFAEVEKVCKINVAKKFAEWIISNKIT